MLPRSPKSSTSKKFSIADNFNHHHHITSRSLHSLLSISLPSSLPLFPILCCSYPRYSCHSYIIVTSYIRSSSDLPWSPAYYPTIPTLIRNATCPAKFNFKLVVLSILSETFILCRIHSYLFQSLNVIPIIDLSVSLCVALYSLYFIILITIIVRVQLCAP